MLCEWASSDERRAFHFFQHVTAPCLSAGLDGAFWRVLVLQICQSEPAVRHAVLAVSSLHEGMVQGTMAVPYLDAEDRNSFALYQYNRAIAYLLDQMRAVDARPLVPLLTCVLFVCIELMQSKDRESLIHLEQGRQILSQLGRKTMSRNPEIDLIKQHLVPMYSRLSLTSFMFGGDPVAIPAPLKTMTEVPMAFETMDEVRYALYDFMDECLRFTKKSHVAKIGEIASEDMRAFENQQDYLLRKLAKFKVAFSLHQATRARDAPPGSIALIQIHIHTTFIFVSTALCQHETVFDDYVDTFSAIIPLATEFMNSPSTLHPSREQQHGMGRPTGPTPSTADTHHFSAVFTFEMHVIAPLYFVAAKCRHPMIRRAALDLLRRNPARRENLWRANVMAAIAERTMQLEEKHLRPPHRESQPPSQPTSPPELAAPFPGFFGPGEDAWASSFPDAAFQGIFGPANPGAHPAAVSGPPFDGFNAAHAPLTSSCSSSATTESVDAGSMGDLVGGVLVGHMSIDPTMLFDATEVSSAAHSYSAAPSIASSIDDVRVRGAVESTPYLGPSAEAQQPSDLWTRALPPGIALEPPTPMDDHARFVMPPSSHPHSQPRSGSHSREPSPSVQSEDGSPLAHRSSMGVDFSRGFQQQYMGMGMGGGIMGHQSPTTVSRSADAPFDVPERFRVHESIIGPDREDGTSWVMMFRKLGGLDAEWDVSTEYVSFA
jgi:hypothetical protein